MFTFNMAVAIVLQCIETAVWMTGVASGMEVTLYNKSETFTIGKHVLCWSKHSKRNQLNKTTK